MFTSKHHVCVIGPAFNKNILPTSFSVLLRNDTIRLEIEEYRNSKEPIIGRDESTLRDHRQDNTQQLPESEVLRIAVPDVP